MYAFITVDNFERPLSNHVIGATPVIARTVDRVEPLLTCACGRRRSYSGSFKVGRNTYRRVRFANLVSRGVGRSVTVGT